MANKQSFTPRRMDQDPGKHDARWHGGDGSRTKWFVGVDERRLCQQLGFGSSEVGCQAPMNS